MVYSLFVCMILLGSTSEAASVTKNDENKSSKQKNDEKRKMLSTEEKNVLMVNKSGEHEATLHNITFSLEKVALLKEFLMSVIPMS